MPSCCVVAECCALAQLWRFRVCACRKPASSGVRCWERFCEPARLAVVECGWIRRCGMVVVAAAAAVHLQVQH